MEAEARDYYHSEAWESILRQSENVLYPEIFKPSTAEENVIPFKQNVHRVLQQTGIDIANAKVEALEGNILGLYNTASMGISLDESILMFEQLKQYHVMLHEAHHKRFDLSRNGDRIDSGFEEGLNELLCKRSTGITLAYAEEQQMVREVARANDTFAGNLVEMFKSGDSIGLNRAWSRFQEI